MEYVQIGCFIIVVLVGIWYMIDTLILIIKWIITKFFKNESKQRTKVSRRRSKRT